MYGMEVSFKVSALKNKIFISWLVVVLVLYVYKHYRHIMTGNIPYPLWSDDGCDSFVILFKMFLVECLFFGLLVSGFIFSAITYQEM